MTRRLSTWAAVTLGLFAWFLCLSCSSRSSSDVLRVGVVLPLTGDVATYGNNAKDGIELAEQELNAKAQQDGGIKIRTFFEDSKGEPQRAVSAIQKLLAANGVSCVIGDVTSSATLAMAPIANKNKVVLMSPAASAPAISQAGDFIFRVWPSDDFEASVVADYMQKKPYRKIAVLLVNNDYGQAMLRSITSRVKAFGGTITAAETFQQNTTDLRTQIVKLAASKPEVVFLVSYPKDSILFLRQYEELGIHIPIVSTSSFDDPQILKDQGRTAEGAVFSSPLPPDGTDPIVAGFRESYTRKFGKKPGLVADYGYDALRVLAEAAKLSRGTDGDALRSGLREIRDFHGASGLITFDANGDVLKPAGLRTVRDGRYVSLK
ncbi:MAG TPA: penicillin-binding protein activator [Terriglobales bacterium]|nr:penicillin-binding protein activator [Terriglobales bacterium]